MFQPVRNDAQGEGLRAANGSVSCFAVGQRAGQLRHLGNPPAVFFLLGLNGHRSDPSPRPSAPTARPGDEAVTIIPGKETRMGIRMDAIGMVVRDLEASLAFYRRL